MRQFSEEIITTPIARHTRTGKNGIVRVIAPHNRKRINRLIPESEIGVGSAIQIRRDHRLHQITAKAYLYRPFTNHILELLDVRKLRYMLENTTTRELLNEERRRKMIAWRDKINDRQ